jgi:hypothetical protein
MHAKHPLHPDAPDEHDEPDAPMNLMHPMHPMNLMHLRNLKNPKNPSLDQQPSFPGRQHSTSCAVIVAQARRLRRRHVRETIEKRT